MNIRITTNGGTRRAIGDDIVAIKCTESAFGKPGVVYALSIPADNRPAESFAIRNDKTGQKLGMWVIVPGTYDGAKLPLWTFARNDVRNAPNSAQSAAQPVLSATAAERNASQPER